MRSYATCTSLGPRPSHPPGKTRWDNEMSRIARRRIVRRSPLYCRVWPPSGSSEQEAPGLVDLAPEVVGGELVGLVHHDQVPLAVPELVLKVFAAGELVQAGDQD